MEEEDNWDIEFNARLDKQYAKNKQELDRYEESARYEEDQEELNREVQLQNLAASEAANLEEDGSSGLVNNIVDFAKFIPIGAAKGVEEVAQTLRIADDNAFNLPEPKNIGASLGQGLGQFLPLFMGGGWALRGGAKMLNLFQKSNKLSKAGQHLITIGAGGLSDAAAFDPKDPNLGNLALAIGAISESPRASAMVKEYLAQQDTDDETKARMKNALIGGLGGELASALGKGIGYAFKGSKSKVTKADSTDGVDEDGFLKTDEDEITDSIDMPDVDKGVDAPALDDASKEIMEDAVDIIDAAKASPQATEEIFETFNKTAPSADEAVIQTLTRSESAVNQWFDKLSAEEPAAANEIVDFFHDRINGKATYPISDFRIRTGKNAGKPLIESMNFLKFETTEDARQAMQFFASKMDIKRLVKPTKNLDDFNTVVPELLGFTADTNPIIVNNAIKQIALAAANVDEAIKFVGTSKLMAGILDDQLQVLAKADVAQATPASRKALLDKIQTSKMVHAAGGLLSKSASDLLRSFQQGKKAIDTESLLKREMTDQLLSSDPKIVKANSFMIGSHKDQDNLVKKIYHEELKTTRTVSITRGETTIGKRINARIKSLKSTLSSLKSPSRGKFPKKAPATSAEITELLGKIKKVRAERDTVYNKFKKESPEQVKIQAQAAKLSKEIEDLRAGKIKGAKGKELEPTEISQLRTTKTAELKKLQDKMTLKNATQKKIDKLNTEFSNLLIKRVRQDTEVAPIPKAEKTALEKELQTAINREKKTLKDRVDTKELQRELILKGSRQIQDEINKMDLRQLKTRSAALHKGAGAKTMDTLLEININGLLSSAKTIGLVNPLGSGSALVSTIIERAFAGAFGNQIAMRESAMLAWNSITGLGDAFQTFLSVMRKGTNDPNIKTDLGLRVYERSISKEHFNLGGSLGAAVDFMGTVVNIPGKLLLSTDQAFKSLVIRGETKALAYRKARNKFEGENLSSSEAKRKIATEYDSIMNNLTDHPDVTDGARETALKTSFTNDLPEIEEIDRHGNTVTKPGSIAKFVQSTLDKHGILRVFVPFFKTPVNVLSFTLERTPVLQFLSKSLRKELTGSDQAVKQLAMARVGTSNAIAGAMFGAAMQGNFTGAPPQDWRLKANLEAQMGGPHWFSVYAFGGWRKYDKLDPYGVIMASMAGVASMAKTNMNLSGNTEEDGDPSGLNARKYDEVINSTIVGIAGMLKDRHYVQGISEFVAFATGDSRGLTPSLKRLATAFNPTIGFYSSFRRGAEQGMDPNKPRKLQRGLGGEGGLKPAGLVANIVDEMSTAHAEAFAAVTPGYGNIPPQKNLIGDIVAFPGTNGEFDVTHNLINTMLNISPGLIPSKSALINKIAELEMNIDQPHNLKKIGNIILTEEEKSFVIDQWTSLNKEIVEPIVKEPWFNSFPTGTQKDLLEELIRDTKQMAKNSALVEFPDRLGQNFMDDTIRRLLEPVGERPQGFQSLLNRN